MTIQSVSPQSPIPESPKVTVSGENLKAVASSKKHIEETLKSGLGHIGTDDLANKLGKLTQRLGTELSFSVDRDLNQVIVTVARQDTKEVIRQIPPEEVVELAKRLKEMESGGDMKGVIVGLKG